MATFNGEKFINKQIKSILNQTYSNFNLAIQDDGSNDTTVSIINKYMLEDKRIIFFNNDTEYHGAFINFQYLSSRFIGSNYDFYMFADQDDIWLQEKLRVAIEEIEKIGTDGEREIYQYPELQLLGEDLLASFAYRKYAGIQASACNYLVKTSLLRDHHHRFMETDYWEDLVFTFDLVTLVSRAVLLPDITYYYWCHENSLSRYQHRHQIPKEEILRNAKTVDHLRETSALLYNKAYYPNRCYNIVMTGFYMACNVLKRRRDITPSISDGEIKALLAHPATLWQICHFRQSRFRNWVLYLLGRLPAGLCVSLVYVLGKLKKLV